MMVGVVVVALGGVVVVRLHCGGGWVVLRVSLVLFLFSLMHTCIFVYQMGRLCGGAHEISGIPATLCLCGWVVGGFMGWVGVWWYGWCVHGRWW